LDGGTGRFVGTAALWAAERAFDVSERASPAGHASDQERSPEHHDLHDAFAEHATNLEISARISF
jgi:hypothetical protein